MSRQTHFSLDLHANFTKVTLLFLNLSYTAQQVKTVDETIVRDGVGSYAIANRGTM